MRFVTGDLSLSSTSISQYLEEPPITFLRHAIIPDLLRIGSREMRATLRFLPLPHLIQSAMIGSGAKIKPDLHIIAETELGQW